MLTITPSISKKKTPFLLVTGNTYPQRALLRSLTDQHGFSTVRFSKHYKGWIFPVKSEEIVYQTLNKLGLIEIGQWVDFVARKKESESTSDSVVVTTKDLDKMAAKPIQPVFNPYTVEPSTVAIEPKTAEPTELKQIVEPIENKELESKKPKVMSRERLRIQRNVSAIDFIASRSLNDGDYEHHPLLINDKETLRGFTGFGGLTPLFNESSDKYKEEREQLKSLLSEEDYRTARESILNAYYTPEPLARLMRDVISTAYDNGHSELSILEPSCGSGVFLSEGIKGIDTHYMGVEMDGMTAQITKALYSEHTIIHNRFEKIPLGQFDAVLSNPPFGSEIIHDKENDIRGSIHNVFMEKSIKSLKPGGIFAAVVSHSFMDAKDDTTRKAIANESLLLKGVRLPDHVFSDTGAKITCDVLVFQKRLVLDSNIKFSDIDWIHTTQIEIDDINGTVNRYFSDSKSNNVLGDYTPVSAQFGKRLAVQSKDDLSSIIEDAKTHLLFDEPVVIKQKKAPIIAEPKEQPPKTKPKLEPKVSAPISVPDAETRLSTEVTDDDIPYDTKIGEYFVLGDSNRLEVGMRIPDVLTAEGVEKSFKRIEIDNNKKFLRLISMINLREQAYLMLQMEKEIKEDTPAIIKQRAHLNELYDDFVSDFGLINDSVNHRVFYDDSSQHLIEGLELDYQRAISEKTAKEKDIDACLAYADKAQILLKRVFIHRSVATSAQSPSDALSLSLSEKGGVHFSYMIELLDGSASKNMLIESLKGKIFQDPASRTWVSASDYLSGNVKKKLSEAIDYNKNDENLAKTLLLNIEHLEKSLPKDELFDDIGFNINSHWLPKTLLSGYFSEITDLKESAFDFTYNKISDSWDISIRGYSANFENGRLGTNRLEFPKLIEKIFSNKKIEIFDKFDNRYVLNIKETEKINLIKDEILDGFRRYVSTGSDGEHRLLLEETFNREINTSIPFKADGSLIKVRPLADGKTPRKHQADGAAHILQGKQTQITADVGTGKTITVMLAIMEAKRMGLANKPCLVVPNAILSQWRTEFSQAYPEANVLIVQAEDFSPKNRKRLYSKIALNNWDCVVLPQSIFSRISVDPQEEIDILNELLDEIIFSISVSKESGSGGSLRAAEKKRKSLEDKISRLHDKIKKSEGALSFGELGFDAIFVDESHYFKGIPRDGSQLGMIKGMGDPIGSSMALDLFIKTQVMLRKDPDSIISLVSATPITNSLAEIYSMLMLTSYDTLKEINMASFDTFANTFLTWETGLHVNATGQYVTETWLKGIENLRQIKSYLKNLVITTDDVNQNVINEGGKKLTPDTSYNTVVADQSPFQEYYFGEACYSKDDEGNAIFKIGENLLDYITLDEDLEGIWRVKSINGQHQEHIPSVLTSGYDSMDDVLEVLKNLYVNPKTQYRPDSLRDQFDHVKELTEKTEGKINALVLTHLAGLVSLDQRLIDPLAEDFKESKTNKMIRNLLREYKALDQDKNVQLIFCDSSIPLAYRPTSSIALYHAHSNSHQVVRSMGLPIRSANLVNISKFDEERSINESFKRLMAVFTEHKNGAEDAELLVVKEALPSIEAESRVSADDKVSYCYKVVERYSGAALVEGKGNSGYKNMIKALRDELSKSPGAVITRVKQQLDSVISVSLTRFSEAQSAIESSSHERTGNDTDDIDAYYRKNHDFSVYDDVRRKLIMAGIPEKEIAFVHECDGESMEYKEAFQQKIRDGKIRFVLGSTQKLGTGMNIQNKVSSIHNLDIGWNVAALKQRIGRMERQGNMYKDVMVNTYLTNGSGDTRRLQINENKQIATDSVMAGKINSAQEVNADVLNVADMKAESSGSEFVKQATQLEGQLKKVGHKLTMLSTERKSIKEVGQNIKFYQSCIEADKANLKEKEQKLNKDSEINQFWSEHKNIPVKTKVVLGMSDEKDEPIIVKSTGEVKTKTVMHYTITPRDGHDSLLVTRNDLQAYFLDALDDMPENTGETQHLLLMAYRGVNIRMTLFSNDEIKLMACGESIDEDSEWLFIGHFNTESDVSMTKVFNKMNKCIEESDEKNEAIKKMIDTLGDEDQATAYSRSMLLKAVTTKERAAERDIEIIQETNSLSKQELKIKSSLTSVMKEIANDLGELTDEMREERPFLVAEREGKFRIFKEGIEAKIVVTQAPEAPAQTIAF